VDSDWTLPSRNRDDERPNGEHQNTDYKQYQRRVDVENEVLEEEHSTDEYQHHPYPKPSCSSEHPVLIRSEEA
jgi:hypothetical protein